MTAADAQATTATAAATAQISRRCSGAAGKRLRAVPDARARRCDVVTGARPFPRLARMGITLSRRADRRGFVFRAGEREERTIMAEAGRVKESEGGSRGDSCYG